MTYALIMAGGEGTRLRPFTQTIPKPLLPIGRKPIAQIIVERLRDCGISDFIMSLQYGSDLIRAYFQNGRQFGVRIGYYQEPQKLGTAGCLAHIPQLKQDDFLVTNGDVLTDLDYMKLLEHHKSSGAALTMAVRRDRISIPYGVVKIEGDTVVGVEEKPCLDYWFNAGVYAISPSAIEFVPKDRRYDMTDLAVALINAGLAVKHYPIETMWFDLAKADDFERALAELEKTMPELL